MARYTQLDTHWGRHSLFRFSVCAVCVCVCFCGFVLLFFFPLLLLLCGGGGYPRHASDLSREWAARSALGVDLPCRLCQLVAGSSNIFYFILFIFSFFVSRKERKWTIITREEDQVVLFLVQVSRFRFHITWHDRVRTTETDTILILIPPNSIVVYILYI